MKRVLHVPGAPASSIERGVAAAQQRVFGEYAHRAFQAAQAAFARAGWDIGGFDEVDAPSDAQMEAAATWDDAELSALAACCGQIFAPAGSFLLLDTNGMVGRD